MCRRDGEGEESKWFFCLPVNLAPDAVWVPQLPTIPTGHLAKAVRCGEIEVGAELPDRQMPMVPAVSTVCACGAVPSDFGSALGFANHCRKCAVNTRFLAARAAAMARIGEGTARAAATKRPPDEDEKEDEEKDDGVEDPDCAQILEMFRAEQEAEEAQLLESMAAEDENEEEEGGGRGTGGGRGNRGG